MKKIILISFFLSLANLYANDIYPFDVHNNTMVNFYFDVFNGISSIFKSQNYVELLKLVFLVGGFFVFSAAILGSGKSDEDTSARGNAASHYFSYMVSGTLLLILILGTGNNDSLVIESKDSYQTYCSSQNEPATVGTTVEMPGILPYTFSAINQMGEYSTQLAKSMYTGISSDSNIITSLQNENGIGSSLEGIASLSSFTIDKTSREYKKELINSSTFGNVYKGTILESGMLYFFNQCIFGVSSINSSLGAEIIDTIDNTSSIKYTLRDIYNNQKLNTYSKEADTSNLTKSIDISTIEPDMSSMLITYWNTSGSSNTGTCKQFYEEIIVPTLDIDIDSMACSSILKKSLTPASIYFLTGEEIKIDAPNVKNMILQVAMSHFYSDSKNKSQIEGQMEYAGAKSIANKAYESLGTGTYMAKMLPYLQMGIRAVLYAFFPFVFLVILLPGGFSVAKTYLKSLLWVELWTPVAAVLNMFMGYFMLDTFSEQYNQGSLSAVGNSAVITESLMLAGVAGYLYASVPALTYLILESSSIMLRNLFDGLTSEFAKNMDTDNINKDIREVASFQGYKNSGGKAESLAKYETLINEAEGLKAGTHMGTIDSMPGGVKGVSKNIGLNDTSSDMKQAAKGREFGTDKEGYVETYDKKAKKEMRTEKKQYESLNEDDIERISLANATELNRKDFATRQFMEYEAKKRGIDLSTAEGRKQMAEIAGGADSAKQIGEFAKLEAGTKQYLMQHGYTQEQVDKMQRNGTLMTEGSKKYKEEGGQTDGTSKANKLTIEKAIQEEVYGEINGSKGNLTKAIHAAVAEEKIKNEVGEFKYHNINGIVNSKIQSLTDKISLNQVRSEQTIASIDMAIKANVGDKELVSKLTALKTDILNAKGTNNLIKSLAQFQVFSTGLDRSTELTDLTKNVDLLKESLEAGQTNRILNRFETLSNEKKIAVTDKMIENFKKQFDNLRGKKDFEVMAGIGIIASQNQAVRTFSEFKTNQSLGGTGSAIKIKSDNEEISIRKSAYRNEFVRDTLQKMGFKGTNKEIAEVLAYTDMLNNLAVFGDILESMIDDRIKASKNKKDIKRMKQLKEDLKTRRKYLEQINKEKKASYEKKDHKEVQRKKALSGEIRKGLGLKEDELIAIQKEMDKRNGVAKKFAGETRKELLERIEKNISKGSFKDSIKNYIEQGPTGGLKNFLKEGFKGGVKGLIIDSLIGQGAREALINGDENSVERAHVWTALGNTSAALGYGVAGGALGFLGALDEMVNLVVEDANPFGTVTEFVGLTDSDHLINEANVLIDHGTDEIVNVYQNISDIHNDEVFYGNEGLTKELQDLHAQGKKSSEIHHFSPTVESLIGSSED